jgi:hypothetical protein
VGPVTPKARKYDWFDSPPQQPEASPVPQWPAPLKPAAFHGIAGDVIEAILPQSEADPAALLIQFLIAIANLVGRGPYCVAQSTRHSLNLFTCLVGATSRGRKGSSLDQILFFLRRVDENWSENRVRSGLASGEGLIYRVRDAIEEQKPVRVKGRITGYEAVITDHGEPDKRLLLIEPEFARVLQVIERETNTLSCVLRQSWDSGNLENGTKNSPLRATNAHISLIAHITKAELDRFLSDTAVANGFANRFLWLCVRRSRLLPEGGDFDQIDLEPFVRHLKAIVERARRIEAMRRDEALRGKWADFYQRCAHGGCGLFDAATSRAESQTMRIAAIFAWLDQCATIRTPHLDAALAVWQFADDSARFLFGSKIGDPTADQILAALRTNTAGLTRSELHGIFHRNKPAPEIDRALNVLLGLGLIRSEQEETGGRSATRFFFV